MLSYLGTKIGPSSMSVDQLSELNSSISKIASLLRVEQSCGSTLCKIVCACEMPSGTISTKFLCIISQDYDVSKSNRFICN